MAKWKIFPYKQVSKSAKALSEALGGKVLKVENSKWKPRKNDGSVVINWGSTKLDVDKYPTIILNYPANVATASNKLLAFQTLKDAEVSIPVFTSNQEEARKLIREGKKVVCRTKLSGHSGEGIVIVEEEDQLVDAPLFTEYLPKKQEYRVHVFRGKAFFIQRKARNREIPDDQVDWKVRNHQNGFIYAHKDVQYPDGIKELAASAVDAIGLDFGAVDIVVSKQNMMFVLEVNTACGLEGTTLEKYRDVLQGEFQ